VATCLPCAPWLRLKRIGPCPKSARKARRDTSHGAGANVGTWREPIVAADRQLDAGNCAGRRDCGWRLRSTLPRLRAMPRQSRLPILLALACTLFLRALVPAGWMPAPIGGAFAIEPCPTAEVQPVRHMAHHTGHTGHNAQHDGDCSFSPLSASFAAADLPPALPAPQAEPNARPASHAAPPLKTGPPALPPPATGPPALA
jgi:hypothetical protein